MNSLLIKDVYLVSGRSDDAAFVDAVARECGVARVVRAERLVDVQAALDGVEPVAVFIDADDSLHALKAEAAAGGGPSSLNRLHLLVSPEVFADERTQQSYFQGGSIILRKFEGKTEEAGKHYGRALRGIAMGSADFDQRFASGKGVQRFKLSDTEDKRTALSGIHEFLARQGCHSRITGAIENAVDELLINAIFDAPVDSSSSAIYSQTPRGTRRALKGKDEVELRCGYDGKYLAFTITDLQGSLERQKILRHVAKNHRKKGYSIDDSRQNGGLGLSLIFSMGASFLFACQPGKRTEVTIFYRLTETYRDFQLQFQFISTYLYPDGQG